MKTRFTRPLLALFTLLALAIGGCAPLTFSHEGAIDFERYRVVYIQPVATDGDLLSTGYSTGLQDYLAAELAQNGGFTLITLDPTDPHDVVLVVRLFIDRDYDYDDDDLEWDVEASWVLRTPAGQIVDDGRVNENAGTESEAAEEAMDAIAYRYLAPYRL